MNGCENSDQVTVTPMYAIAGPDDEICIGDTLMLSAIGGNTYSWDNGPFLSDPNIADPLAFPSTTVDFIVTVSDTNGCVDTDTTTITVNPLPNIDAGLDQTICLGTSTAITATGGVSYVWAPTTGLSDPNIANPLADPVVPFTYKV